jgi:hypothetical protein
VGVGTPDQAHAFRAVTRWKGTLLVDAEGRAHAAAALRRLAVWRLLSPGLVQSALEARKEGFRQTKTEGDPWRLGGTLVLRPGDVVAYAWRNANAHDDAPLDEVLAALEGRAA